MQIQNQRGRDDTIDPYYLINLARKGAGGTGDGLSYAIARRVGSDGRIYYQLIASDGTTSGDNIVFSASDLLYDNNSTVSYVLENLIRRDGEIQEILENIETSGSSKVTTFDDLDITVANVTLSEVIAAIAEENLDSGTLVVGTLDSTALPTGLSSADVEVKVIAGENGTYYEINAYSDFVAPYKWTALYKDNEVLLNWTDAYNGGGDAQTIANLQLALESHSENETIHISEEERLMWNNHVGV